MFIGMLRRRSWGVAGAVLALAVAVWSLTTAATALTVGFTSLLLMRLLLGLGECVVFPGSSRLFAQLVPEERRGAANGWMSVGLAIGPAIGTFAGSLLAGRFGWQATALSVLAATACAALRQHLPGYHTATPDTLQHRFLQTSGVILKTNTTITVRLDRRAYSPILRQANLPDTTIPWWGNRRLHLEYAQNQGRTR